MAEDLLNVVIRLHQDLVVRIEQVAAKADLKDLRNEMLSGFDAMYKKFDRLESGAVNWMSITTPR